jgi:hypothetical protein
MGLLHKLGKRVTESAGTVYSVLPIKGIHHPVFILGCGRSGTTILGSILSRHNSVTYLNEPRQLWTAAYPNTDIWNKGPGGCRGNLLLTAADTEKQRSKRISRLFRFETIKSGKPVLIEKLPANSFRLQFIQMIFPDASYIHLYRHGLEVARSIENLCRKGKWFSANPYKWELLSRLASSNEMTSGLLELCTDDYHKGLLEWRLNTDAATSFLDNLPTDSYIEISYNTLVDDPDGTIDKILTFIGLSPDPAVSEFARGTLGRRSRKIGNISLSEKEKAIGGKLLPVSQECSSGLTMTNRKATSDGHCHD